MAESFNGLYKTELISKDGPWYGLEDVEHATLNYLDWSNTQCMMMAVSVGPAV